MAPIPRAVFVGANKKPVENGTDPKLDSNQHRIYDTLSGFKHQFEQLEVPPVKSHVHFGRNNAPGQTCCGFLDLMVR